MPYYGFTIKGFGVPAPESGYTPSLTIRFSTVDAQLDNGSDIDRVWVDALAPNTDVGELLNEIHSLSIEPMQSSSSFGSATFQIQTDDHNGPLPSAWGDSIMRAASKFLSRSNPKAWGVLMFDQTPDYYMAETGWDPLVDVMSWVYMRQYPGMPDLVEGQLLFVGREVLQVVAFEPRPLDVSAIIPTQTSAVNERLCRAQLRRGACGSRQQAHRIGALDDIEVFTVNQVILSRDVEVYRLSDDLSTEEGPIWVGRLDKPTSNNGMGTITCPCIGELVTLNEAKVGLEHAWWSWDLAARDRFTAELSPVHARATPLVALPGSAVNGSSASMVVVRAGAVQGVRLISTPDRSGGMYRYQVGGIYTPLLGSYEDRKSQEKADVAPGMVECLVTIPGLSHFRSSEDVPYTHPFDILLCLLTSRDGDFRNGEYDCLPHGWGRGIDISRFDVADIQALRSPQTGFWFYANLSMDSLLIQAREGTFRDILERLLRPLLCFITETSAGLLTIRPFIDAGPDSVGVKLSDRDTVEIRSQDMIWLDPVTDVRYKLARRGAGGEYSGELLGSSLRGVIGKRFDTFAAEEEVNALDYGNPDVASATWYDSPGIRALQALVTMRWGIANAALHKYQVSVQVLDSESPHGTYWIRPGAIISMTSPALRDPASGENGLTDARCIVTSASLEGTAQDQVIDLVNLGVTYSSSQTLAPSWFVETSTDTTNFTVSGTAYDHTDARGWLKVLWVCVYDPDTLEPLISAHGVRQILSVDTATGAVVMASAWILKPAVGAIIGLAPAIYFTAPYKSNYDHTYLAEDEGVLIDSALNILEPHHWGY